MNIFIKQFTIISFLFLSNLSGNSDKLDDKTKLTATLSIITQFILMDNTSSVPNKQVVDISLQPITLIYQAYTIVVYSDTPAPTTYSKESLAIHGTINSGSRIILEVNSLYPIDTKFLVVVKNSSDEIVIESSILSYDNGLTDIDFGNLLTSKQ